MKKDSPIIPIFINHDYSNPSIGRIEFNNNFDPYSIDWSTVCFAPTWIERIDNNGHPNELIEVSLVVKTNKCNAKK